MKIYGLKNCDGCRRARRELAAAGHPVVLIDVRDDPLPDALLGAALAAFGEALVNRRSATWRGLDEAERGLDPAALLRRHPAAMKRPLFDADGRLFLGWTAAVRGELLG